MSTLLARFDQWWTRPLPNAAGRYGLYRMVFALSYLWHVSEFDLRALFGAPSGPEPFLPFLQLLPASPSMGFLQGVDVLLVLSLFLLAAGIRVPLSTALVLVVGLIREALLSEYGVENGNLMPIVFIPLLALVAPGWGHTYSLDAWSAQRRGEAPVSPANDSWRYALTVRSVLILLAVLFPMAGWFKVTGDGTWLRYDDLLPMLLLRRSVDSVVMGWWANPLGPWLSAHASIGYWLQIGVVAFELSFVLLLAGTTARRMLFAALLVFHAVSALWVMVSFGGMLAAYALFVDWESLWQRVRGLAVADILRRPFVALGPHRCLAVVCIVAAVVTGTWHAGTRHAFTLGGLINWRTIWFVVTPVGLGAILVSLWRDLERRRFTSRESGRAVIADRVHQ